jgi:hypothetical protein
VVVVMIVIAAGAVNVPVVMRMGSVVVGVSGLGVRAHDDRLLTVETPRFVEWVPAPDLGPASGLSRPI